MRIRFVDLPRQNKNIRKEIFQGLEKVVMEANFIEGEPLKRFEKAFAKFLNKKFVIGLNSGTDAIKLALLAYGIKPGDEVITVPNSYFSTAMVISDIGAIPVFVDADPNTYNIDVSKIEGKITKETKAIIPVHLYGQSADMEPVIKIAKKHKLIIIEDVCQSHGAKYKGKILPVTETGAFSFYPGKNLGAFGDGGAIATDNPKVYEKILYLRNDGSIKKYTHNFFGIKSRLDTLQGQVLLIKLPNLNKWNKARLKNAKYYDKLLSKIPQVIIPRAGKDIDHVYHIYAIKVEKRDQLQEYLLKSDIETNIHYPLPIHLQKPYMRQGFKKGDFPTSEDLSKHLLSLPMFPELTFKEIEYICKKIADFFERKQ